MNKFSVLMAGLVVLSAALISEARSAEVEVKGYICSMEYGWNEVKNPAGSKPYAIKVVLPTNSQLYCGSTGQSFSTIYMLSDENTIQMLLTAKTRNMQPTIRYVENGIDGKYNQGVAIRLE